MDILLQDTLCWSKYTIQSLIEIGQVVWASLFAGRQTDTKVIGMKISPTDK
jgi:hypothetical protein